MEQMPEPEASAETLDALAQDLRRLRESVGASYREIAALIAQDREASGMPAAAAAIAHSTVADAFRMGRARINANLVVEIVRALGADSEQQAAWRARCLRASAARRSTETTRTNTESAPVSPPTPSTPPPHDRASTAEATALSDSTSPRNAPSPGVIAMLIIGGILLNATGKFVNPLAGDVLFLDMIGTAVVALLLGPWSAAAVGVGFISVQLLKGDIGGALFASTMVTSGLIWGYGVHRLDLGRTLARFVALSAVVAVCTTAIAAPIIVFYYGGLAGRGADPLITQLVDLGPDLWAAVTGVNLALSLMDKILTGILAYCLARLVTGQRMPRGPMLR